MSRFAHLIALATVALLATIAAIPASAADQEPDDDDRDELQEHAQAHQLLREVGAAAPHHVDEAEEQHAGHGEAGEENELVGGHGSVIS